MTTDPDALDRKYDVPYGKSPRKEREMSGDIFNNDGQVSSVPPKHFLNQIKAQKMTKSNLYEELRGGIRTRLGISNISPKETQDLIVGQILSYLISMGLGTVEEVELTENPYPQPSDKYGDSIMNMYIAYERCQRDTLKLVGNKNGRLVRFFELKEV